MSAAPPVPPLTLTVPDAPGPGPWVDCQNLGESPECQLSAAATANDLVNLETAGDPSATLGKYVAEFSGGPNAGKSFTLARSQGSVAQARAVRLAPPPGASSTTGLTLVLSSSNLSVKSIQGPPGPVGGSPASGSITTDGVGGATLKPGSTGIATVAIVVVDGANQLQMTFTTPFTTANYPVHVEWFNPAISPSPLNPIAWVNTPPTDGRTLSTLTFSLWNTGTGALVDPSTHAVTVMVNCG